MRRGGKGGLGTAVTECLRILKWLSFSISLAIYCTIDCGHHDDGGENKGGPLNARSHMLSDTLHTSADMRESIDKKVLHCGSAFLHPAGKGVCGGGACIMHVHLNCWRQPFLLTFNDESRTAPLSGLIRCASAAGMS